MAKVTRKVGTPARRRSRAGEVIKIKEGIRLPGGSDMRTIPRVFESPKERLHDTRGRPSSKDLIRREAQRRVEAGALPRLPQLNRFGRALSVWLHETYPDLPQMMPRAVENIVRDIWRQRQKTFNSKN
jgi:hypothetical protein